jgi:hypothetical protein
VALASRQVIRVFAAVRKIKPVDASYAHQRAISTY